MNRTFFRPWVCWALILTGCLATASRLPAQEPSGVPVAPPGASAVPVAPPGSSIPSPAGDAGAAIEPSSGVADGGSSASRAVSGYSATAIGTALIQADSETGSVVVVCDEATHEQIAKIVENLDRSVPQVLIKVLFLEVTHTDDLDLGVEGEIKYGAKSEQDAIQTAFGLASETQGGFYKIIDEDLAITLRALATSAKLEVLSRPSVLARNNQEAVITVGQEVPFITNSRITDNGDTINTIQYNDIGIILRVTPRVGTEQMVEMDVEPEISTLTGDTVPISNTVNARVIAKRSAQTHVVVANGKTVVIGGMMEDNNTASIQKIPLLGDIPYLGALFRRTVTTKSKTEPLIFLTPHIVENPTELRDVSLSEKAKAEMAPTVFSDHQIEKYIDNLKK